MTNQIIGATLIALGFILFGALIIHIVIKAVLWLAFIGLITLIGAVVISAVLLKGVAK